MNYRHSFHAGNHADVFKHAALTLVLAHLKAKPAPFAVLDTHAGVGAYDLAAEDARRTREHEAGVGRVFGAPLPSAPDYARLLAQMNPDGLRCYPGSPEIVRRLMRDDDRLAACELHPQDHAALKARYRGDRRIAAHRRDGYEAVSALLPPAERRGLVLIDPPFEAADETDRLIRALTAGLGRWPTGIFMAWYPIKDRRISDALAHAARSTPFPKALRAELLVRPMDGVAMAGSGLLIYNAPWKLDEKLEALCAELARRLDDGGASWRVDAPAP